ncbi:MAG: hypothetical protein HY671_15270, partial [Chloroflexi bacterium]|nr:hypothetical protein [Chloroflexota bacterium]
MFYYWAMPKRKTSNKRQTTKPHKTTNKAGIKPRSFYTDSLTNGEKERLPDARKVEGLDEEIALLRVKLNQLVGKHSDDTDGLVKTVRLLLQAV